MPSRNGYLEALGAWSTLGGPLVRLEASERLTANSGAFAFAQYAPTNGGVTTGGGYRWVW